MQLLYLRSCLSTTFYFSSSLVQGQYQILHNLKNKSGTISSYMNFFPITLMSRATSYKYRPLVFLTPWCITLFVAEKLRSIDHFQDI